jgi:hypothetical protein
MKEAEAMEVGTDVISETPRPRLLRSIGATLAGLLAIVILSTATDMALHATGIYPPINERMSDKLFVLATAYRVVFGIAGCYLAARLAPDRPMKHALILGVVGLVLSIAGAAAMWDAGPGWYSLAIIAIALPCAWIGGKVVLIQRRADD